MDLKLLFTVFATIFVAELGDKTQLTTLLFASGKETHRFSVFLGAALALIAASAVAVLAGAFIAQYVSEKQLNLIAGIGFIGIGVWTLLRA